MKDPKEIFDRLKSGAERDPWPKVDVRRSWLEALKEGILKQRHGIRQAVWNDFRKSPVEADLTEVVPVLLEMKTALRSLKSWAAPHSLRSTFPLWGLSSTLQYNPKGTVLIVSPWNYPINLTLGPLVSALAAGNRVAIKPSERVPHSSAMVATIVRESLPQDVVMVVEGGPHVGAQLLDLPFDHFYFTGGATVGEKIRHAAARHFSTATLELGGKSPAVVDGSVDLDQCAEKIVRGKFMNGGQTCIAPDYAVVRYELFDEFVKHAVEHAGRFERSSKMSSPVDDLHAETLESLLAEAADEGANLHRSTSGEDGLTIVTGVPLTCRLMQEEILGPILPVLRYRSEEELVGIIKTNPSPLTMYIFSKESELVTTLSRIIKTGSICVNETLLHFVHPAIPFGGVGRSGSGRSHGRAGFETFSNSLPIMRQNLGRGLLPLLYPGDGRLQNRLREMVFKYLEG